MCIAFFEWTEDRFLVCHNRDEYFSRPTTNTEWWPDEFVGGSGGNRNRNRNRNDDRFEILAPRDVVSGGTWFGFEKTTGRCAFLTNIRDDDGNGDDANADADASTNNTVYTSSRGELVIRYLTSDPSLSALDYLQREFGGESNRGADQSQTLHKKVYDGFNLVVFSGHDLAYVSNRTQTRGHSCHHDSNKHGREPMPHYDEPVALEKGKPYGLSNSLLYEPLTKVTKGLEIFSQILDRHRNATVTPMAQNDNNDETTTNNDTDPLLKSLEHLMRHTDVFYDGEQDRLPASTAGELSKANVRKHRSSIICLPQDDQEYGTRTTIHFLLQSKRESPGATKKQPPQCLRWIEQNWNPNALEPEDCLDLDCPIPS
eukprot:jgi/Psemu1/292276/fgenesh1_pg.990_\